MTDDQITLLRDKVEVWARAAECGSMDLRDYNARAAEALGMLLRRYNELKGEVGTLRLQQQTDRQTIAASAAGLGLDEQSQGRLVNYDLPPSEPDQGEVERVARIIDPWAFARIAVLGTELTERFNRQAEARTKARAILSRSTTLGRTEDE